MINENNTFSNKPFKSSNFYEDIDIPLENRDYDVLQDEKKIQIQNENNISNKPL